MKLSHLLLTTSLCAVAAGPVLAQSRTFSSVDTNGDGQLSIEELEAAIPEIDSENIKGEKNMRTYNLDISGVKDIKLQNKSHCCLSHHC